MVKDSMIKAKLSKIEFIKPSMPGSIRVALDYFSIIRSNRLTNFGPMEQKFREDLNHYHSKEKLHFTTVSSATSGIEVAVKNIFKSTKEANLVLIPSFTFAAAASILTNIGYEVVFYDVNVEDMQPNLLSAKDYIENNRKNIAGIIYCNSFGIGTKKNIKRWLAVSKDIPFIIDSAAGFCSRYEDGSLLGGMGDCEIFSFHATKTMSVGEGGAISSKSKKTSDKLRIASNFGFNNERNSIVPGTNAKMQEINAAIGIRQLKRIERSIKKKHSHLNLYSRLLSNSVLIPEGSSRSSLAFLSILLPNKNSRDECIDKLEIMNIPYRTYYSPVLSEQTMFKDGKLCSNINNTLDIKNRVLSLPLYDKISKKQIRLICNAINEVL